MTMPVKSPIVKVGVYVDAFNLYYGGRSHCGRSTAGWRWLDIRAMVSRFARWSGASIGPVVYCTARVSQADSPSARVDQDIYIAALLASGSVTEIVEGHYVSWAKTEPLTALGSRPRNPSLHSATGNESLDPSLPLMHARDRAGTLRVMATIRRIEEKGSDVNVATRLLTDVLTGTVDAAVVVSNDSDLALPVKIARDHVPVGLLNPRNGPLAGALRGSPTDGVGQHWWKPLSAADFTSHQLPDPVGKYRKPLGW